MFKFKNDSQANVFIDQEVLLNAIKLFIIFIPIVHQSILDI
jgi:hypothetical protein